MPDNWTVTVIAPLHKGKDGKDESKNFGRRKNQFIEHIKEGVQENCN